MNQTSEPNNGYKKKLFLSHNWGNDNDGRDNHERVGVLYDALQAALISAWLDVECMEGNIYKSMASGIDSSEMIVVFVTKVYMDKVNGTGPYGRDDNCYKEYHYSLKRKQNREDFIIPVVMESGMRNPKHWVGPLGEDLGSLLYIDFCSNESLCECVFKIMKRLGVADRIVERHYPQGYYRGIVNAKGERNSIGIMKYIRGDVYEGAYRSGKKEFAHARLKYANGNVYEGPFVNDKQHGSGKMTYKNGDVYEGTWVEGKREGYGTLTFKENEEKYEGNFKNDKIEGKGKKTYADGSVYEGQFVRNRMHGKGKMTYVCKNVYEGKWQKNKRHGKGRMIYGNGDNYDGDWVHGYRQGKGKMSYGIGDEYDGNWVHSYREGNGTQRFQNGDVYNGQFYQDKMHGEGSTAYISGDKFNGTFRKGKKNGKGKYTFSLGHYYDGNWKDNKIEGYGKYQYQTNPRYNEGDIYQGYFKNGKRHGEGRMEFATGAIYEGQWRNNNMDGNGKCDFEDCRQDTKRVFFRRFGIRKNDATLYAVTFLKGSVIGWTHLERSRLPRKQRLLESFDKNGNQKKMKKSQVGNDEIGSSNQTVNESSDTIEIETIRK